ncbi:MAG: sigma-70 family RNA polymerase sigma factor [Acidobacteria bacterium]|nr:sigma-70 family RNA polymerase sigma factor [Acidobacteriota bacterium]MBV8891447.1 sigma-70 family RNA polymerase sigma factor [Acidobacteriota bacterium]MBV9481781.1 sigma-70 family RNA polymerase sigma factor [Acidobacteriota bacterium]
MLVAQLSKTPRAAMAFSGPPNSTVAASSRRPDDTILVRRAQNGDTAAFEELVRHYDRTVLRLASHLTDSSEDAQDIYQEAFLRAYRNIGRFRFECSFYTWMYRIVANLCCDHLRRKQLYNRYAYAEPYSADDEETVLDRASDQRATTSPERAALNGELRKRILWALNKLSPRERMVFELRHYEGLKLQSVATILSTTENTVKNTLFRATHKLRLQLAEMR